MRELDLETKLKIIKFIITITILKKLISLISLNLIAKNFFNY
jgi:hypothetical protein